MTSISRRYVLAGAAATVAAAMPVVAIAEAAQETPFPKPPYVDRQAFFDGRVDWTFYARRREWLGIEKLPCETVADAVARVTAEIFPDAGTG